MADIVASVGKCFSPSDSSNYKVPNCPYMRLRCRHYNFVSQCGVCQSHGNSGSVRCSWLPSWIPNGYRVAKLRGGHLRV